MTPARPLMHTAALTLLLHGAASAATSIKYTTQSLVKPGDPIANTAMKVADYFEVGTLNDNGQLIVTYDQKTGNGDLLIQYENGTLTPVVYPGGPAANGQWPKTGVAIGNAPVDMNSKGNSAFSLRSAADNRYLGTFRWDAKAHSLTLLALPAKPVAADLIVDTDGGPGVGRPAINNNDEVAFPVLMRNAAGTRRDYGLFLHGRDGQLEPVALPDTPGPDGVPILGAFRSTLDDTGRISFLGRRQYDNQVSGFVWENGKITTVAVVGAEVPGGRIAQVAGVWTNNKNRNLLVAVVLDHWGTGPEALYLWNEGTMTPVVLPGREMPGGGQFTTVLSNDSGVSLANDLGHHAFYCRIVEENKSRSAAYLMDADGSLTPILKTGATTEVGTITSVGERSGFGIGLNKKGQVAVGVTVAGGAPAIVLLTPDTTAAPGG